MCRGSLRPGRILTRRTCRQLRRLSKKRSSGHLHEAFKLGAIHLISPPTPCNGSFDQGATLPVTSLSSAISQEVSQAVLRKQRARLKSLEWLWNRVSSACWGQLAFRGISIPALPCRTPPLRWQSAAAARRATVELLELEVRDEEQEGETLSYFVLPSVLES